MNKYQKTHKNRFVPRTK